MIEGQSVYFIRPVGMEGPVKIGCTYRATQRMDDLMAWSPLPLEIAVQVPGNFDIENRVHAAFYDLHSHKEWFRADPRLTEAIERLQAGEPLEQVVDLNLKQPMKAKAYHWTHNPEARLRCIYSQKLSWAERRGSTETHYCSLPSDVETIMRRWRGTRGHVQQSPSAADFARLDAVIADPASHVVRTPRRGAA